MCELGEDEENNDEGPGGESEIRTSAIDKKGNILIKNYINCINDISVEF